MDYNNDRNNKLEKNGGINLSEGSAINHLTTSSDSHDTNVTNVYYGKSADEQSLAERKKQYRDFCRQVIRDGIISKQERKRLDDLALELSLDDFDKRSIEESILKDASTTDMLTPADQMMLGMAIKQMENNSPNVKDQIPKLEALAEKVEQDEPQFYYYLLLAIEAPSTLTKRYENKAYVNYWQSFWAYIAYTRMGFSKKAMDALNEFQKLDGPEDNVMMLQCAGWLYDYFVRNCGHEYLEYAQEGLKKTAISFLLYPLQTTLNYLVKSNRPAAISDSSECNFYLRLFEVKEKKSTTEPRATHVIPEPISAPRTVTVNNYPTQPVQVKTAIPPQDHHEFNRPASVDKTSSTSTVVKGGGGQSNSKWVAIASIIVCLGVGYFGWNAIFGGEKKQPISTQVVEQVTSVEENSNGTTKVATTATTKEKVATQAATPQTPSSTKPSTASSAATTTSKTANAKTETSKINLSSTKTSSPNNIGAISSEGQAATVKPETDPVVNLKVLAEEGNKDAQYNLGMRYYDGNGVTKNMSIAFQYLKPLAEAGYVKAYFPVADMYHRGQGVAKDRNEAEKWYQKAADAGDAKAKRILMNSF